MTLSAYARETFRECGGDDLVDEVDALVLRYESDAMFRSRILEAVGPAREELRAAALEECCIEIDDGGTSMLVITLMGLGLSTIDNGGKV